MGSEQSNGPLCEEENKYASSPEPTTKACVRHRDNWTKTVRFAMLMAGTLKVEGHVNEKEIKEVAMNVCHHRVRRKICR